MGLTHKSTGKNIAKNSMDGALIGEIERERADYVVAIGGNPNVGKSTVFNALTGMKQHTGNWAGKTVTNAQGRCRYKYTDFLLVDVPGAYSLTVMSEEERAARDFICFGEPDCTVIVCDATCLERNLNLVLQTLELTDKLVVCVNLMDEAEKKGISVNTERLETLLGVPVVGTSARSKKGLSRLMEAVYKVCGGEYAGRKCELLHDEEFQARAGELIRLASERCGDKLKPEWVAKKLLEGDGETLLGIKEHTGIAFDDAEAKAAAEKARQAYGGTDMAAESAGRLYRAAEKLCAACTESGGERTAKKEKQRIKLDKLLTGRISGRIVMLLLLALIFYITIVGANYPSELLSRFFAFIQDKLTLLCEKIGVPDFIHGALVLGVYRVLAWVVSVMLPPMAIFFPLFTLLEDVGYLPRIAFNLDESFRKCRACGKQALCMCMGFGCNAAGVVGCRIIDSPRERAIAVITNSLVPCNGRFPTMIALITVFFAAAAHSFIQTVVSAAMLTAFIVLGIAATFFASKLLSSTLLKGVPSSCTLELPPFRRPQVGKVIVRSIVDRTLFVLGRAAAVAAPAGLVIWLLANVSIDGTSLLKICTDFLDPAGRLLGLDGVILMAFILGLPANEIVLPIIIMAYTSTGVIDGYSSLESLRLLLADNGWTWVTAICFMLFSLMHWPCSTTISTIWKETRSVKYTLTAIMLPTAMGAAACIAAALIGRILGVLPWT